MNQYGDLNEEVVRKQNDLAADVYKAEAKRLRILLVFSVVACLIVGWLFGSFFPAPGTGNMTQYIPVTLNSDAKIEAVQGIMESDWFFGKDIEDLDTRLTDQALYGITANEEDPHTSYMSSEEIQEFTQSINRNFVGIGVQFIVSNGVNLIDAVFRNSPAERAGIQPGDLISAVDGVNVEGETSDRIKELVLGDEGTPVVITVQRGGEYLDIEIIRGAVNATATGRMIGDVGYFEMYNFGDSTADEMKGYLDDFVAQGATKLIIDLRDNGGGYLDSLQRVASFFLPKNTVVMRQAYPDESEDLIFSTGNEYKQFDGIVILINANTASASEVLTMALKEKRDDVYLIGTTSYGKGTVQVTRYFDDGSALKYTTSRWLSPDGVWVNNVGIEPDETVLLHDIMYRSYTGMADEESYDVDSVSRAVQDIQLALDFMDYDVDRTDGYYSESTKKAVQAYQTSQNLTADGVLTPDVYRAILSSVSYTWTVDDEKDPQLQRALEYLHE